MYKEQESYWPRLVWNSVFQTCQLVGFTMLKLKGKIADC